MSLKKIEQVKKDKGFKLFDLIIYSAVLVIVAVLFIVIFATRNTSPLTGVRIYVAAEVVFEYEFDKEPTYSATVTEDDVKEEGDVLTVTVKTQGGGINVVTIDKAAKTVKMKEANCNGKQCLYFHEIDDNNRFIYCSPHGLRIEPLLKVVDSPDIII